jgi:hypothetical protein
MVIVKLSPRLGDLNFLLNVSLKSLLSITTQFTLPLDLFKEPQKLGSDGVMTA